MCFSVNRRGAVLPQLRIFLRLFRLVLLAPVPHGVQNRLDLAQGNFVLAVSEGTFGGAPTAYYDLWRVENGKIAEHWDVMETIADKSTWANNNGKF